MNTNLQALLNLEGPVNSAGPASGPPHQEAPGSEDEFSVALEETVRRQDTERRREPSGPKEEGATDEREPKDADRSSSSERATETEQTAARESRPDGKPEREKDGGKAETEANAETTARAGSEAEAPEGRRLPWSVTEPEREDGRVAVGRHAGERRVQLPEERARQAPNTQRTPRRAIGGREERGSQEPQPTRATAVRENGGDGETRRPGLTDPRVGENVPRKGTPAEPRSSQANDPAPRGVRPAQVADSDPPIVSPRTGGTERRGGRPHQDTVGPGESPRGRGARPADATDAGLRPEQRVDSRGELQKQEQRRPESPLRPAETRTPELDRLRPHDRADEGASKRLRLGVDAPKPKKTPSAPQAEGPGEPAPTGRNVPEAQDVRSPETVRMAAQEALRSTQSEVIRAARYIQTRTRSEVRVQLHPPELGRMRVSVEMREGQVEVRIRVEDPAVRDAIRNELANLDRALKEAQVNVSRFEVGDYHQGPGGERQEPTLPAPYRGSPGGADLPQPTPQTEAGWVRISDSGRMDCLV